MAVDKRDGIFERENENETTNTIEMKMRTNNQLSTTMYGSTYLFPPIVISLNVVASFNTRLAIIKWLSLNELLFLF